MGFSLKDRETPSYASPSAAFIITGLPMSSASGRTNRPFIWIPSRTRSISSTHKDSRGADRGRYRAEARCRRAGGVAGFFATMTQPPVSAIPGPATEIHCKHTLCLQGLTEPRASDTHRWTKSQRRDAVSAQHLLDGLDVAHHSLSAPESHEHVMIVRMVGHTMAEAEDFFYQVGVKTGLAAIYEEGSGNPVLFQQPQQFRRGLRIRAVVEGQGHGLPAGRAATDNRQVEVGSQKRVLQSTQPQTPPTPSASAEYPRKPAEKPVKSTSTRSALRQTKAGDSLQIF